MSFKLNWTQLLSDQRYSAKKLAADNARKSTPPSSEARTGFERDCDRIIFSAPFRRLARKTQVHPFAEMDHIHNRLTHTLEVASVGRSLGTAAGRFLVEQGEMPEGRSVEDIACIVQAACLAHDIGNPPFGHAGEFVIREWSKSNAHVLFENGINEDLGGISSDWMHFEGNAQAFRMMAREDDREELYFRLTYASLGTLIKYPWDSQDPRVNTSHKLGVFTSERVIYKELVETLGLTKPDGEIVRHPLSFLSEAADDICYRITDFEDAVHLNILSEQDVRDIFKSIIGKDSGRPLSYMRAQAISTLIKAALEAFQNNYESIMTGNRNWSSDLKSSFPAQTQEGLKSIKERYNHIFSHRRKVATELGSYNTLGRILGTYARTVKALSEKKDYAQLSFVQKRCIDLAWGQKYAELHQNESYAWWLGHVMDFVAGMTDNYAIQVSSEIAG